MALPFAAHQGDLSCDPDSLHRSLRPHSYFKDEEDSSPPAGGNFYSLNEFKHHKCRVASMGTFNPPGPQGLESMIVLNEHHFNKWNMFTVTGHNNLKTIKELQNMPNIMIKSADKGRAIFVQSREQYLQEWLRQLADTKFYMKQALDTTDTYKTIINEFLTIMYENCEIDFSVYNYLLNKDCRTPIRYLLQTPARKHLASDCRHYFTLHDNP